MKMFYVLLFALFMAGGLMAQTEQPCSTCLPGGIFFTTQAQVNSYQIHYPNYTEIEGNVMILSDNITNLSGLSMLTSIRGNLTFCGNNALPSLTGLDNLTAIGEDLSTEHYVYGGNPLLISLSGLVSYRFITIKR